MEQGRHPGFTIDQREGTVTGPAGTARLEPRVMQVLSVLAGQRGRVVPREELLDTIWPGVVVTEYTLNRCIYRLRRALDAVAGAERTAGAALIETLPKRGYRLLADVTSARQPDMVPAAEFAETPPPVPYVVGQWVRGERFYGRTALVAELLHGQRDLVWLLGTRRVGKTSLLKQVELVSGSVPNPLYFALYWDFQGVDTPAELHLNFADALLDAEENLQRIGIRVEDVRADDLFVSLDLLRRQLRARGLNLLLLCDEVEELLGLQREDPSLLRKLRHALQSHDGIRTVLASTIRLWALADQADDTSPFLHGFTPPLYMDRLTDQEARALVRQAHLRPEDQPQLEDEVVAAILRQCDNHPYLLQLVSKRYVESQNLTEAIEQVATDRMVAYFFSVDHDMLSPDEQRIVQAIADRPGATRETIFERLSLGADLADGSLRQLANLGFLRRDDHGGYALASYFFQRWLEGRATAAPQAASGGTAADDAAPRTPRGVFRELRRRKVFRVAAAYVVLAWVLLQLGDVVFDFLEVPIWAGKLLLALLVLGLPVAVFLAWAFELTPHGIQRDRNIEQRAD